MRSDRAGGVGAEIEELHVLITVVGRCPHALAIVPVQIAVSGA